MTHNIVIRSLRYTLNINDNKIIEILNMANLSLPLHTLQNIMKDDDHPDYIDCDEEIMAHFLDGLIYYKRGRDESKPPMPFDLPITNNVILKKLRVAFNLKESDLHEILELGGYPVSRAELTALMRKKDHPNYRECGDQILRYFLKGLKLHIRG